MARYIASVVLLLSVSQTVYADDGIAIPDRVAEAADKAEVEPLDLLGATLTTGLDPFEYLYQTGELVRPIIIPTGWPIGGALGNRIYCVEGIESRHGAAMYNSTPWYGEHAQGWLGWLPSTAYRWGAIIGNRASEWAAAARMILSNNGGQFYGIGAGLC